MTERPFEWPLRDREPDPEPVPCDGCGKLIIVSWAFQADLCRRCFLETAAREQETSQ